MRVAILGAGFTGLTAALRLLQSGHEVSVFEKEDSVGGLAMGFTRPEWRWSLENAYHHWFTNDDYALQLAQELDVPTVTKRPSTDVYIRGKMVPFDSALSLLQFPYLSLKDRLTMGISLLYLKGVNDYKSLEGKKAIPWIRRNMGKKVFDTIWDPLFTGKFGQYKDDVALTWFWARVKKRTKSLAYPVGGFARFAEKLAKKIERLGGKMYLREEVRNIEDLRRAYDKTIVTLPTPVFITIAKGLPREYVAKLSSVEYLHALNLILILEKPFMERTYWLNITDRLFPFLVLVEHTNFMDAKQYGGQHIVYIGNYLLRGHRYFKMRKEELLKEFDPFLQKINADYSSSIIQSQLCIGPFAQPIVTVEYPQKIPSIKTPIPNVFLANLAMVYPWDRGTNYAIELGERVAKLIIHSNV